MSVPQALSVAKRAVTVESVAQVLATHVLPYVRNHGGDLQVTAVDDSGLVTCKLEGACRSCPAAAVTMFAVVERALQAHLDPAIKVRAPQIGVSPAAVERIRKFYPQRVSARRGS